MGGVGGQLEERLGWRRETQLDVQQHQAEDGHCFVEGDALSCRYFEKANVNQPRWVTWSGRLKGFCLERC